MRWGNTARSFVGPAKRRAFALALLVSTSAIGQAQGRPQTREGFWIGFGFGYGSLGCEDCDDRTGSAAGFLRMGGTLNKRWLIGGEIEAWSKEENGVTLSYTNVAPVVLFYPSATNGFFLKGGLGIATVELEFSGVSGDESGAGLLLGLGYDGRVGKNFSLTPYLNISAGNFDGGNANMFQFGLSFTWH